MRVQGACKGTGTLRRHLTPLEKAAGTGTVALWHRCALLAALLWTDTALADTALAESDCGFFAFYGGLNGSAGVSGGSFGHTY